MEHLLGWEHGPSVPSTLSDVHAGVIIYKIAPVEDVCHVHGAISAGHAIALQVLSHPVANGRLWRVQLSWVGLHCSILMLQDRAKLCPGANSCRCG